MAAKRIPQLLGPSGRMFPPPGCRRSFPREPAPWWDGPWPGHPGGPEDAWDGPPWDGPPWEEQPRRRRRRRCPPSSRTFPGPGDGPWNEEEGDRRWAPPGCPLPPPWGDREAVPGAEDDFGECWYRDPPPDPWPEYPEEEQPQPWSPSGSPGWVPCPGGVTMSDTSTAGSCPCPSIQANPPILRLCSCRNPGNFHQHRPPWSHRPRQSHPRLLIPVPRAWCPRPSRGLKPRSKPSCPAPSRRSQPAARKEPEPPQPPAPPRGAAERPEQPQDVPVGTGNVLEPPSPARSPRESPAADPGAAEPQVELEAEQIPEGSQDRDPCAPGTDPAPPEETSRHAEVQEHPEVEPCSVPKAGSSHGSHPQSPAAPAEPAKRELLESSCSGGAELSPHSWEQLPCGAGEAEAEAAQGGSLQPPEHPQLPPGPSAEAEAQPSQASPAACTPPETSPGPQHPPGAADTTLGDQSWASDQHCSPGVAQSLSPLSLACLSHLPGCVWPAAALPRAPHALPSWHRLPLCCCPQKEGKDRAVVPAVQPERCRGGHDAAAEGALDGGGAGAGTQGQPAPGPPAPPAAAGGVHRQPGLRGLLQPLRAASPSCQGGGGCDSAVTAL